MSDETISAAGLPLLSGYVPLKKDEDEWAAIERIRTELQKVPPPEAIRKKGKFSYLHSYYVFARANQVFGELNVTYLHRASRVLFTGKIKTQSGERDYVVCEATAGVLVALPGNRSRYSEGVAPADGMGQGYGDAFNIASKGAFSDARKLALRPFGKTFGLDFSIDDDEMATLKEQEEEPERSASPKPTNTSADHTPAPLDSENRSGAASAGPDGDVRAAWGKLYLAIENVFGIAEKDAKKQKARDLVTAEYPKVELRDITVVQIDSVRRILNTEADRKASAR